MCIGAGKMPENNIRTENFRFIGIKTTSNCFVFQRLVGEDLKTATCAVMTTVEETFAETSQDVFNLFNLVTASSKMCCLFIFVIYGIS